MGVNNSTVWQLNFINTKLYSQWSHPILSQIQFEKIFIPILDITNRFAAGSVS